MTKRIKKRKKGKKEIDPSLPTDGPISQFPSPYFHNGRMKHFSHFQLRSFKSSPANHQTRSNGGLSIESWTRRLGYSPEWWTRYAGGIMASIRLPSNPHHLTVGNPRISGSYLFRTVLAFGRRPVVRSSDTHCRLSRTTTSSRNEIGSARLLPPCCLCRYRSGEERNGERNQREADEWREKEKVVQHQVD